jgi:hypothetical protein
MDNKTIINKLLTPEITGEVYAECISRLDVLKLVDFTKKFTNFDGFVGIDTNAACIVRLLDKFPDIRKNVEYIVDAINYILTLSYTEWHDAQQAGDISQYILRKLDIADFIREKIPRFDSYFKIIGVYMNLYEMRRDMATSALNVGEFAEQFANLLALIDCETSYMS